MTRAVRTSWHSGRDRPPPLDVAIRAVYDRAEALGPTRYSGGMRMAVLPARAWCELRAAIIALGSAAGYAVPESAWSYPDTADAVDIAEADA